MKHIPRIYTQQRLKLGSIIDIWNNTDTFHHLVHVLRIQSKDNIKLFNEVTGEWLCDLVVDKSVIRATCSEQIRNPQINERKMKVIFPLIHPNKINIILEKCTELMASDFFPIVTEYTQFKSLNIQKAEKVLQGASEQCGRLNIPILHDVSTLSSLLNSWPSDEAIVLGDIDKSDIDNIGNNPSAILAGPEGGFSQNEQRLFNECNFIKHLKISDGILRSETAIIAMTAICSFQKQNN